MDVSGFMEMDAENGGVFFGQNEEDGAVEGCLGVDGPFSVHDGLYTATRETLEEWVLEPHCVRMDEMQGLNDSDPEDVLHAINPNDVYPSAPPGESPSESDSGISEDPRSDTPPGPSESIQGSSTIYQVVYDISSLSNIKKEPEQRGLDVISIELDEWNAHMLMSDSCIVNELPLLPSAKPVGESSITVAHKDAQCLDSLPLYPDLLLTDEEQKLLNQEGISLPNNLPLTKAEERILKKVRRKIRNKQSAQDSRRRKKEYIDGLEGRVAACAAQNHELQKTVEQLEKHNMSLLAQLRRLQTLIKQTATKAAQTSTCIMIFLFSLALIIFPSYSPFSWGSVPVEDGYAPAGVISRNILTDPASSLQILEDVDDTVVHQEVLALPPDLDPSNPKDLATAFSPQPNETVEEAPKEGAVQGKGETGNDSTLMEGRIDSLPVGLMSSKGQGSADIDSIKAAHADEM